MLNLFSAKFRYLLISDKTLIHSESMKLVFTKNFSTLNKTEIITFYTLKEKQYKGLQIKIKKYCDMKGPEFGRKIQKNSLIFDQKDGVGYCQIAKVGSSTWSSNFIQLGKGCRPKKNT